MSEINTETSSPSVADADEETKIEFPILTKLGVDLDISEKWNADYVKDLIGECFALQAKYLSKKTKATHQFRPHKSAKTVYTVSLSDHTTENAFQQYQRHTPYVKEFIQVMSRSADGARRLCRYMARHYTNVYMTVGQEFGLGLVGKMDAVESAAMWRDA